MIKSKIWRIVSVCIIGILFAFQIIEFSVESYKLKCPTPSHWKFRAQVKCNSTLQYFCLYNSVDDTYVEGCIGPDWDRKGSKRIYAGHFSRGTCSLNRFQPILFWTNGSLSDCIFAKSKCNDDGQIVYNDMSPSDDRSCTCDSKKSYSFLKTPRNNFYCIPTEEECSCYIKSCPENSTLSSDYSCTQSDFGKRTLYTDTEYNKTADKKTKDSMGNERFIRTTSKLKWLVTYAVISTIFVIHVLVAVSILLKRSISEILHQLMTVCYQRSQTGSNIHVSLSKWMRNKLLLFKSCIEEHTTEEKEFGATDKVPENSKVEDKSAINITTKVEGSEDTEYTVYRNKAIPCEKAVFNKEQDNDYFRRREEQIKVEIHQQYKHVTTDEVNFLRLIHLLFRVACPVVRMVFNDKIQPNQLRKRLKRAKSVIEKQYKKKGGISNHSFDLLYGHHGQKDKTVSSEDFSLDLMIYLYQAIGNLNGGDSRQAQSATSFSNILSKIITIQNAAAKNDEGQLTNEQFKQNWNDIGQAIIKLLSSRIIDIDSDEEKARLIGRILTLNPLGMEARKLCIVVDMADKDHDSILQNSVNEYCASKKDGLKIQKDHIPKSSHSPYKAYKTRQFKDITSEENNFVVVVYGLTTIVYPVIKHEFQTQCSNRVLKHEDRNEIKGRAEKLRKHVFSPENRISFWRGNIYRRTVKPSASKEYFRIKPVVK